ncbi:thermonuclease family protein [Humidesulfovibrio sp.]
MPIVFAALLCLASPAWGYVASVQAVHDGDSITVRRSDKSVVALRLYGIDAPELQQAYGRHARELLLSLAARQRLQVEPMDTDRYGRTVALVRLPDGALLNEALVAEGLAWVYEEYCREDLCQRLRELEQQARREGRGLWAEPNPTRPAQWRRQHKLEEWYQAPLRVIKKVAQGVNSVLRF